MERIYFLLNGLKPALFMVVVQVVYAGVNVLYKLAANDGMSLQIIVAYRSIFATAFMAPLAFIVERKKWQKLTWTVIMQAFFCGLLGCLYQNLFVEAMELMSATFASAMSNLVPAITFILAIFFRLERLELTSLAGIAKVLGTSIGIGGAMLLTFYKGVEINISTDVNLLQRGRQAASSHHDRPALGFLAAIGHCFAYAFWLIIQAKMSERHPFHYSNTALISIMGAIQSTVFAFCVEKDWNQWKLGWNIRLLTVAFSGIVASGLMVILISWCLCSRGPLFVSIFSPLLLICVAVAATLVLDEKLHLGSILGAALIVFGLYLVLWGKSKEIKKNNEVAPSETSQETPSNSKASEEAETIGIVITSSDDNAHDNNSDSI